MKLKTFLAFLSLPASLVFADGWSESGLTAPVQVETIAIKDNNAVLVKFQGVNKLFYFDDKPQMLSLLLTAKSSGSSLRAWTSTNSGYYSTSDIPPGTISSAHYLGAVQIVD